ncbi:ATP-dependent RecD-like DNA helicase [Microbacterium sp.]|uniref:ATP-dependent DNA helicase n=1 Tax=Microbacterium sp. TaxID=51671 RepID=UPI0028115B51|nr:ATP-dependent RecD-like DNA helicase [Microbacterium sp.]
MTTVDMQITSIDKAIRDNIARLKDDRGLLSQNLLAQTRNLIEAIAVRLHKGDGTATFAYDAVAPAIKYVGSRNKKINFLYHFHDLIQKSSSHYTMDSNISERLMLKYIDFMFRLRTLLKDECGIDALGNLEEFPVDTDPALREYHEKIAGEIERVALTPLPEERGARFYIHKTRPFFVRGRVYYEVTFYRAVNKASKFDRVIGFSELDIDDRYAASLTLEDGNIDVLGESMPIVLIRGWEVSIRPCEFDDLAALLGITTAVRSATSEYQRLMHGLTITGGGLLQLMDASDAEYQQIRDYSTEKVRNPQIFPTLDAARDLLRQQGGGSRVIRYLMLRMRHAWLKPQYSDDKCYKLSQLNLDFKCIPFDEMPFCSSLVKHIPLYWDVAESLDVQGRSHELLARRVKNNVENLGKLYTPTEELEDLGDVDGLIAEYNRRLYYKHRPQRELMRDFGHVFLRGYEDDTVTIVEELQGMAGGGIDGYSSAVERWLAERPEAVDDAVKRDALTDLLSESRVALIYGAAGTGKSTMVNHIANYFNDKDKLFLAHTHPAVDNLKRRVTAQKSQFQTVSSVSKSRKRQPFYDILVIDECSTVSNADLIAVIEKANFKLLVLVGDAFQIESIEFGNWFSIIRRFLPSTAVFELTTPFRAKDEQLLRFWTSVRELDADILENMAHGNYSSRLDESLFVRHESDEIILCLNYDGLYGINNINRFMQSSNPGKTVRWGAATYKVGDPVLFNETDRFGPAIYNNLKGTIAGVQLLPGRVQFDITLDRTITEFDVDGVELQWLGDATVRFSVFDRDTSDSDDDSSDTTVPFQVAYAVSIHKAQGLEFDSVKIVVTQANEDDILHSIFYTAVTRARQRLQILWSAETERTVLSKLENVNFSKDVALLKKRRELAEVKADR